MARAQRFEVHTHSYISGPISGRKVTHSHVGGDEPHQHADVGPATYTIDKDAWAAATGLRGGGRKKFTAKPSGPQLERVELEAWQKSFTVIVGVPVPNCPACGEEHGATGGGMQTAARMVLAFGMAPRFPSSSSL